MSTAVRRAYSPWEGCEEIDCAAACPLGVIGAVISTWTEFISTANVFLTFSIVTVFLVVQTTNLLRSEHHVLPGPYMLNIEP